MAMIEVRFRAGRKYASACELLENLGIAKCLCADAQTFSEVKADGALVKFTHASGAKRAVALLEEGGEFVLLVPNNHLLYSRIYSLLNRKGLVFTQKMSEESAHALEYKTAGLLKSF